MLQGPIRSSVKPNGTHSQYTPPPKGPSLRLFARRHRPITLGLLGTCTKLCPPRYCVTPVELGGQGWGATDLVQCTQCTCGLRLGSSATLHAVPGCDVLDELIQPGLPVVKPKVCYKVPGRPSLRCPPAETSQSHCEFLSMEGM
jgi:hypothetical protein